MSGDRRDLVGEIYREVIETGLRCGRAGLRLSTKRGKI